MNEAEPNLTVEANLTDEVGSLPLPPPSPTADGIPQPPVAATGIPQPPPADITSLETRIGYAFRNPALAACALTHSSWSQVHPEDEHNQRLEFLGDAVLSLILADRLCALMPHKREGVLTRSRATLSKGAQLSVLAREITLDIHLRMSEAEERNGGRTRDGILEDAVEALIGAIYLDSDFGTCRDVVLAWYGDLRERLDTLLHLHNPKGQLQEKVQPAHGNEAVRYVVVEEHGPPHNRTYRVRVDISGEPRGEGIGTSKKEAEENAAKEALLNLADG